MIPVKGIGPNSGFANRPDPERVREALATAVRMREERLHPGCKVAVTVYGPNGEKATSPTT